MLLLLRTGLLVSCAAFVVIGGNAKWETRYTPDWESLDKRPLPAWFDDAKFGIFIHWGVFSVPSMTNEWFWWYWKGPSPNPGVSRYMQKFYSPNFAYADFVTQFRAEFFDAIQWADILKASGANYVVLTAKHHEGFCNWPSPVSWTWNSADVGPRRDLVGELAKAIRSKTKLKFGLYHSMFEWFNPLYLSDVRSNYTQKAFVYGKTLPELYDLVERYEPSVIWSDGAPATSDYWMAKEFLTWLYNESPVKDFVVVNDRWGTDAECQHGDFLNCRDKYRPDTVPEKKWECCTTLDKHSWGFRRESRLDDYMTAEDAIETLVDVVAYGGNLLLNIGPTAWGTIPPIFEERLRSMGRWLAMNGEAIYGSTPWIQQKDKQRPKLWYLREKNTNSDKPIIYGIFANWPIEESAQLLLAALKTASRCVLFDGKAKQELQMTSTAEGLLVKLPAYPPRGTFAMWVIQVENGEAW